MAILIVTIARSGGGHRGPVMSCMIVTKRMLQFIIIIVIIHMRTMFSKIACHFMSYNVRSDQIISCHVMSRHAAVDWSGVGQCGVGLGQGRV